MNPLTLYLFECAILNLTFSVNSCRSYDIERDTLAFTAVSRFLPNEVYYHGCLKSFLQITKWKGPEVCKANTITFTCVYYSCSPNIISSFIPSCWLTATLLTGYCPDFMFAVNKFSQFLMTFIFHILDIQSSFCVP